MGQGEKAQRRDSRGTKDGGGPKILMDSPEDADIFHGDDMKVSCAVGSETGYLLPAWPCPFDIRFINAGCLMGIFRRLQGKKSSLNGSKTQKQMTKGQLQTAPQSFAGLEMAKRSTSLDPSTTGPTRFPLLEGEGAS